MSRESMTQNQRIRAPRNQTLTLTDVERRTFESRLLRITGNATLDQLLGRTICQDIFHVLPFLPRASVDLLIADPPYNIDKIFNQSSFSNLSLSDYERWLESWIAPMVRILKPTASVYICGDWRSSTAIQRVCDRHFVVRNRITWEREKGRGAKTNWKNCSEDIWFCTMGEQYTFHVDAVKLKRRVIAPNTNTNGQPRD
jgi:site-specific DNA-methyltransferase (adenine-specific)